MCPAARSTSTEAPVGLFVPSAKVWFAAIAIFTCELDTPEMELIVCSIAREKDGLAMSSRNAYLTPEQRQQALVLYRSLMRVQMAADRGEREADKLRQIGEQVIAEEPGARLDYFAVVDPETLEAVTDTRRGALVAVAAYVGTTRLIDNIVLT